MTWQELAERAHFGMVMLRELAPDTADVNAAPGSDSRWAGVIKASVEKWLADYDAHRNPL